MSIKGCPAFVLVFGFVLIYRENIFVTVVSESVLVGRGKQNLRRRHLRRRDGGRRLAAAPPDEATTPPDEATTPPQKRDKNENEI